MNMVSIDKDILNHVRESFRVFFEVKGYTVEEDDAVSCFIKSRDAQNTILCLDWSSKDPHVPCHTNHAGYRYAFSVRISGAHLHRKSYLVADANLKERFRPGLHLFQEDNQPTNIDSLQWAIIEQNNNEFKCSFMRLSFPELLEALIKDGGGSQSS